MRRSLLLAGSLSLALHALLFLAFPPPPAARPRPPASSLALRLRRGGAPPPASLPRPQNLASPGADSGKDASSPLPPLPEKEEAQTVTQARPPEGEGGEAEARGTELDPVEAAIAADGGEENLEEGKGPAGGAARSEAEPAEALTARLEAAIKAYIEANKAYPEAARRRGSEGVVRIAVIVAPDGSLRSIRRAASSGSSLLDRAALELLRSAFPLGAGAGRELELVLAISYRLKP